MYSWVGLEKEIRGFSSFTINDSSWKGLYRMAFASVAIR